MRHPLLLALGVACALTVPHASTAWAAPAAPARPAVAPARPLPFETRVLAGSGATLYAMEDTRLPRVWYDLYLEAGERFVPARLAGLSMLAAEVLDRGPATTPYEIYRRDLFRQGIEISWEPGNRFLIAHVKCLPDQLGAATRLVRAAATRPRLDAATFRQLKDRMLTQRKSFDDDMQSLTFHYAHQKLWGFHPNAQLPEGWAETLANIQPDDLRAHLTGRLAHPGAFVSAAGPLSPARLATALAPALAGWAMPLRAVYMAKPDVAPVRRVILVDKPGAQDNQVVLVAPIAVDLKGPEAAAAEVFLAGMGYGLGARLGKALRVERGLTYHASASLRRAEWPSWYAYSFGANPKVAQIVAGIVELFDAAKGGLTDAEVTLAKDQLLKAHAAEMETPPDQMRAVASAVAKGLPPSYPFTRPAQLRAVTAEGVRAQARALGGLPMATLVVMGDASQVQKPITAALPAGTELTVTRLADLAAEAVGPSPAPKP